MYFCHDNQNFVWTSINCLIGQLTETRTAIIFARQLARDGSIIKRSLLLPYAHCDACTRASVASSRKIKDREQQRQSSQTSDSDECRISSRIISLDLRHSLSPSLRFPPFTFAHLHPSSALKSVREQGTRERDRTVAGKRTYVRSLSRTMI